MMADPNVNMMNVPKAVLAGFLGWLIPGAGHVLIGRPARGVIIFLVIGATFWTGMAIGGVMTMDPTADKLWSSAEMLTGAHGIVAMVRQKRVYDEIYAEHPELDTATMTGERRLRLDAALADRGVALVYPADVVARAYAGVAGLLNLLCIFDVTVLALMGAAGDGKAAQAGSPESEVAA
jgi:TM2 domain-containing membrane protein YozV